MLAITNQELENDSDTDRVVVSSYANINTNLCEHDVSKKQTSLVDDICGFCISSGNFFKELFSASSTDTRQHCNEEVEKTHSQL